MLRCCLVCRSQEGDENTSSAFSHYLSVQAMFSLRCCYDKVCWSYFGQSCDRCRFCPRRCRVATSSMHRYSFLTSAVLALGIVSFLFGACRRLKSVIKLLRGPTWM
ncbi:unnamed protein product [Choristocarpus tenellus]